jgi:hypothetical protein
MDEQMCIDINDEARLRFARYLRIIKLLLLLR